jgi:5-hydroxyisourate hydrolase
MIAMDRRRMLGAGSTLFAFTALGEVGQYQLVFHLAAYFTKLGTILPNPPFLEKAVIQFGMADATSHYHVPLLASPWSFTTYRGS